MWGAKKGQPEAFPFYSNKKAHDQGWERWLQLLKSI
jgi:hypothetical protein